MPLAQLPAFLSACFDDLCAALDRRSAPRLFLLLEKMVSVLFRVGEKKNGNRSPPESGCSVYSLEAETSKNTGFYDVAPILY
jgi:hypothetical protein